MAKKFWRVVLELVSHRLGHVARRFELLLNRFSQNYASRPKLGYIGARIRAGRIRQLIVSAASGYTGLAYPRSSDTFGAVSAKRGNSIIVLPLLLDVFCAASHMADHRFRISFIEH